MKIADSAIQLTSTHTTFEKNVQHESLTLWQGDREPQVTRVDGQNRKKLGQLQDVAQNTKNTNDKVSLFSQGIVKSRTVQQPDMEMSEEEKLETDLNIRLLRALFERLTGRKFQVIDPAKVMSSSPPEEGAVEQENPVETKSEGYGMIYDYHQSHYESEKTDFAASGIIVTADGEEIDFSVNLSMSHEFYTEKNLQIRAGDALKDPLVINFAGSAAELTQREFSFDIDADGVEDQISFVGPGSGFLALDKNEDGVINDGSELFGTLSGDGFSDLRKYDSDGNNWIDENDSVYANLRIWSKNSAGEDQLMALGKAGVGALYLGHIETLFSVKDTADNALLGQVKETGLAVMESGKVVTMQQLDLVA